MSYIPDDTGQKTMANSEPVVIASDQSPIPVTDNGGSLTVDGTVAVTDGGGSLTVDGTVAVTDGGGSLTVDGTVSVNDGGGSLTVDGTVAATQSGTWTLGANSGVDIGDVTINNNGGASAVNIQDGGNSITVDGTVAATQSGMWNISNVSGTISLPTGAATQATLSTLNSKVPALGEALSVASTPVTLARDQLSPAPAELSVSAYSINADMLPSVDISRYRGMSLQLTGTWIGSVTVQGSNDDSTWVPIAVRATSSSNGGGETVISTNGVFIAPVQTKYVRVRCTAYTSGTIIGNIQLSPDPLMQFVTQIPPLGQSNAANSLPVVLATNQGAVPVSGTFWQATQPVSAASLPLPSGASTEATLSAASAKLPATLGQKTAAASMAVVLASDKQVNVGIGDGANLDAFSRIRISNPITIFSSDQKSGDNLLKWETAVTGTGNITHLPDESSILMSTGATLTSGQSCIRSTRRYMRYQPGKSQLILMTFAMATDGYNNSRARVGYFDANNGVYLHTNGTAFATVQFALRTSTSGAPVTTSVSQASWNLDPLNGTGPSGKTLDLSKAQILVIDLQWLGVGRVRCGFDIDGQVIYAHEFLNANTTQTKVYMKWASLPCRLEVEVTGTATSTRTLRHICTTVISEGGDSTESATQHTHNNGVTAIAVTTRRPVLSIRAKATGPNSIRNIGQMVLREADITASNNNSFYEIVLNGTLTGASWSAVDATYSLAEKDTSATTISGGIILSSGYVVAGSGSLIGSISKSISRDLALIYSALGNVQDTISIVCTSTSGTSNILAAIDWEETGL